MIKAIVNLELVYPYKSSITTLLSFSSLWNCHLLYGGTDSKNATIAMPQQKFKKIFKTNPRPGKFAVPKNAEKFITSVYVERVETE